MSQSDNGYIVNRSHAEPTKWMRERLEIVGKQLTDLQTETRLILSAAHDDKDPNGVKAFEAAARATLALADARKALLAAYSAMGVHPA